MAGKKKDVKVVMPDGSTVGRKDLGKVKPTPKPKPKPTATKKSSTKETPQDAAMRKILAAKAGKDGKKIYKK